MASLCLDASYFPYIEPRSLDVNHLLDFENDWLSEKREVNTKN
jgi:hypothetical protein